jgi:hypothetical protein
MSRNALSVRFFFFNLHKWYIRTNTNQNQIIFLDDKFNDVYIIGDKFSYVFFIHYQKINKYK